MGCNKNDSYIPPISREPHDQQMVPNGQKGKWQAKTQMKYPDVVLLKAIYRNEELCL